jgi:DNA-binding NtrC family response regulator
MTMPSATVMVVDDEAAVRTAIGAVLDLAGYTVVEASDGEQAIQQIRSRRVDAVISDVLMPSVDGIGLAGWIANNAPAITLLLMSGGRRSVSLRGMPSEAVFFQKPFQMPALLAALKNRLGNKH